MKHYNTNIHSDSEMESESDESQLTKLNVQKSNLIHIDTLNIKNCCSYWFDKTTEQIYTLNQFNRWELTSDEFIKKKNFSDRVNMFKINLENETKKNLIKKKKEINKFN